MSHQDQVCASTPETSIALSGIKDAEVVDHHRLIDHTKETAPTEEITSLKLSEFETVEDLMRTHPNLPQSIPHLQSLDISLSPSVERRWDPSKDPFGPFPSTLKRLSLSRIPFYPSLCGLTRLTELTFRDFAFAQPLDTLLGFLERNPSLNRVELHIIFEPPELRVSNRPATGNKVQHLIVYSPIAEDIKALISQIPLVEGGHLEILCDKPEDFPSYIMSTEQFVNLRSPTSMDFHHAGYFKLSGPKGSFSLQVADQSPRLPFLKELPGIKELCKGVESLGLRMLDEGEFDPSLFPALRVLIIEGDDKLSGTLSKLDSSPESFTKLRTLVLRNCSYSYDFEEKLTNFASKGGLTIIHEGDRKGPGARGQTGISSTFS